MKNVFTKEKLKKSEIFRKAAAVASALAIVLGFTTNAVPTIGAADGSGSADGIAIDETNFPDAAFRQYVSDNCDTDTNGYLSDSEIAAVTSIDVGFNGISDMTGIEHFTALTNLYCYQNSLTALDVSQNTALEAIDCHNNQLTALDVSQNTALTWLDCYNNQLTALDVSQNAALERLDCLGNQLTELDVSQNTALETIDCHNNQLTALDVSQNAALTWLDCYNNQLTALDVSQSTALEYLECYNNQLAALDVSQNTKLAVLNCSNNRLAALDVSQNTALIYLDCAYNQLTSLDVNQNAALAELYCNYNHLTSLDVSKNTALIALDCGYNQLTALDLSKNTALTELYCHNNRLTALDVSKNAALNDFNCSDNKYTVCGSSEVAIADLPGNFDSSKATNWTNAEVKDGKIISDGYCTATYTYDCGNSETAEFSIEFSKSLIAINETNFPDAAFRQYVSENIDNDNSGYLSDSEIAAVTHIYAPYQDISDMKGIEYFTSLTELYCYGNQLTELDVSQNTALETLICHNNQLAALDVSQNTALTELDCSENQLTELSVSQNTALTELNCNSNQLTELDVSQNTALTDLNCSGNRLTALDVSQNTALIYLECTDNQLTELDVSQNTALTELYCYNNRLTALDVSQNASLEMLYCYNNRLTALDVSQNASLEMLYCHSNQLTALDVSQNTALRYFGCNDNKYTVCGSEVAIADLPGSFDPSKATNWTNAKAEDGKIFSEDFCTATYTYDCGNNKTETFSIEFIEHTGGTATCTQKAICDTCGEEYGDLAAHTLTKTDAVPATCTAAGNEAYWTCSECGKMFSDEDGTTEIQSLPTIPILGHDYGNDWKSDSDSHWHECTVCGDKIDSAAHTEDNGTVTKQPTASETGERTYKCTVCGNVIRTETIGKLPSGGGDFVTPTEPTDPTEPSGPADPTTPDEPITPSRPDNEVPFIKDENGKNGWEVINEEIGKAEDGGTITVDMNGATVVTGNVFDTLRGRDVTVVFDMGGGITWSVNGKDVTFGNTSDIDFSVKSDTENIPVDVINNITGERYSIQISLAHNGEFGFTAVLSINLGSGNAGQKAALYYYDGGILELMCESEISADGTARLKFTHASDYLIVIGESETDESDTSDITSGESNPSEDDNSGTTSGTTSSGDTSEPGKKDPDEQNGNPSTGVATSLIPLAIAAAFIVAAAKRKIK